MNDTTVQVEIAGRVGVLTLCRRSRRNALDGGFADAVAAALRRVAASGATVVVLRSDGPVFCSGVDVSEPMRLDEGSPELVVADALLTTELFVVTTVAGPALAGGLIIAAVSPLVVADRAARFWLPERRLGIFPGRVLAFLEEVVPPRQAWWYALSQRHVDAEEARRVGLVSEVVAVGTADDRARELAAGLAAEDPAFLAAARDAWRCRFRTEAHRSRREEYDTLLRHNVDARG